MCGQGGFGMELDALDCELAMPNAHYFAFSRLGGDLETGRNRVTFDHEGVVACCGEGVGQPGENSQSGMPDR